MSIRTVVYTAIFGQKDDAPVLLNRDAETDCEFDFVCVTDNTDLKSDDYRILLSSPRFADVTKNAREVKINGFPGMENYDVAIWHDSSVHMDRASLTELAAFGRRNQMSTFHHKRGCAYMEAIACIDQKKDSPIRITLQMIRYFLAGMPAGAGFHETTIAVYRCATYLNSELHTLWWNEVKNRSRRDQLALAYARWKTGTGIHLLEGTTGTGFDNRFSKWVGHRYPHYLDTSLVSRLNSHLIRGICKKLIYAMRRRR